MLRTRRTRNKLLCMKPGRYDRKHKLLIRGAELRELKELDLPESFGLDRRIERYQRKRPLGLYRRWLPTSANNSNPARFQPPSRYIPNQQTAKHPFKPHSPPRPPQTPAASFKSPYRNRLGGKNFVPRRCP